MDGVSNRLPQTPQFMVPDIILLPFVICSISLKFDILKIVTIVSEKDPASSLLLTNY